MQGGATPVSGTNGTEPGSAATAVAEAHATLIRDRSLQFDRVAYEPPPPPPAWMEAIARAFAAMGPFLQIVFWVAVAVAVAGILWFIAREIIRLRAPPPRPRAVPMVAEPDWRPDAGAARDLLAAADRLAGEGRYAEAAHLLLLRSVEDIQSRRPRALRQSLTTREIATLSALPESARPAFARIGLVVERSLFGGAVVGADDFADCRQAYEAFALPNGWAG